MDVQTLLQTPWHFLKTAGSGTILLLSLLLLIISLLVFKLWIMFKLRKFPPGPPAHPIIGSLLSLQGVRLYRYAHEHRNDFGEPGIMTYYANSPIVVVNDIQKIKSIFLEHGEFTSERPVFASHRLRNPNLHGIINGPGEQWVQSRRLAMQILRDLGYGKSIIEASIRQQCEYLRDYLAARCGQPLDMSPILGGCTSDIISMLLFNTKPAMDGSEDVKYVDLVQDYLRVNFKWVNMFPFFAVLHKVSFLKRFVPNHGALKKMEDVNRYLRKQIVEHRRQLNEGDTPRDFVDHYLVLQQKTHDGALGTVLTDESLVSVLVDLFLAGTDTTSVTLCWALVLLSQHPEVQEHIFAELSEVSKDSMHVDNRNLNECPYTRAVISEVLRFGVIAPLAIPHTLIRDIQVGKFTLSKGAVLFPNIYAASRDPKAWKHPEEFYPEHFFDSTKKCFLPHENMISFGIGRRSCVGEGLARQELFAFLGTMVLGFRFSLAQKQIHSLEDILGGETDGAVRGPKLCFVEFQRRS